MTTVFTIVIAIVVSIIVSKIVAAHYFRVMDSYVKDMIEIAKGQIREAYVNRDKR